MKKINMEKLIIFSKGIGMGTADIIPGVSGGTIALISGIYNQLIDSLGQIKLGHAIDLFYFLNPLAGKAKREQSRNNLTRINWGFLIPLLLGIMIAILTVSKIIPGLLEHYPAHCFSFFFGLIVFSLSVPFREVKIDFKNMAVTAAFAALMFFFLANSTAREGSDHLFYVFISGAIAICAMILPGISGSYILVILGQYKLILKALNEMNLSVVAVFILGIVVGIYSFLRVLKYLLSKYHSLTMAAMTGVMLGSLRKIWPYLHTQVTEVSYDFHVQIIALMIIGGVAALILDRIGKNFSATPS